ncbi:hypothetical protein CHS0354_028111 [Potamilus streckersoni]|uniref:Kinase n=1 Tax=Potamilus streckersoni TaxID=2493646 RepID=A0AAE0THV6_9BIVA|nr:hypothetical protein CHS0354_028111 [Potamilus streckersoni]
MPPGVLTDLLVEACLHLCGKKGMDNDFPENPHLPKGTVLPRNQVAGHKHEGRSKLGLLQHEDGTILKASQKPPRGTREVDFYKQVFDATCTDKTILQLRSFLPRFFGVCHLEEYPDVTYLKLENIVYPFRKPCVVDIKMGKRTYDPEAGPAKIAKEVTKFPYVEKFGFQFTGMQTYDPVEQKTKFYDKFFCRKLGEDELLKKGLGAFFNLQQCLRRDAIQVLLEKLREIESWFASQTMFSFYASSLLLVYEGDMPYNNYLSPCIQCHSKEDSGCGSSGCGSTELDQNEDSSGCTCESDKTDDISSISIENSSSVISTSLNDIKTESSEDLHNDAIADVRMIDFTHVFSQGEIDENYLFGLRNLIRNLEMLLELPS